MPDCSENYTAISMGVRVSYLSVRIYIAKEVLSELFACYEVHGYFFEPHGAVCIPWLPATCKYIPHHDRTDGVIEMVQDIVCFTGRHVAGGRPTWDSDKSRDVPL